MVSKYFPFTSILLILCFIKLRQFTVNGFTTYRQFESNPSNSLVNNHSSGPSCFQRPRTRNGISQFGTMMMATVSEQEAKSGIDKVVKELRKDRSAQEELGKLTKVNNVLGYGSPRKGILAVRFNASFQKGGKGMSAVPLPFGLGQSNTKEGRGTMVGQVKASINTETGKVVDCSVFRDLGYGRAFNLKI